MFDGDDIMKYINTSRLTLLLSYEVVLVFPTKVNYSKHLRIKFSGALERPDTLVLVRCTSALHCQPGDPLLSTLFSDSSAAYSEVSGAGRQKNRK